MSILTMHHGLMAGIKQADPPGYVRVGQHLYPIVKIGNLFWMAENLKENYIDSEWYNNDIASESKLFGKLYTWSCIQSVKTSFPSGWRIPLRTDTEDLRISVSSDFRGLRSTSGWWSGRNGYNTYGFNIVPSGFKDLTTFANSGGNAQFWIDEAYYMMNFSYTDTETYIQRKNTNYKFSLRLVKDA